MTPDEMKALISIPYAQWDILRIRLMVYACAEVVEAARVGHTDTNAPCKLCDALTKLEAIKP